MVKVARGSIGKKNKHSELACRECGRKLDDGAWDEARGRTRPNHHSANEDWTPQ